MDTSDIHHGLAGKNLMFVIASQTAVASKPAKGAFHHPTTRQDLKSFGVWRTTNHFQFPAAVLFDPDADIFVSTIGPDQFETTPAIVKTMLDPLEQFCQNQLASIAIRQTRPMDQNQQEQAQSVDNNMTFASRNLFIDIHAAFFATFGGFDALAVNNACAGLRFSALPHSNLLHQHSIDFFPQTAVAPVPVVAIHGLPRGQIMRHQTPSTSATNNVQNRIQKIALAPGPWSSTSTLPLRQQWRNQRPLGIIQIGRVGLSGHAFKSNRPFSKHSLRELSPLREFAPLNHD